MKTGRKANQRGFAPCFGAIPFWASEGAFSIWFFLVSEKIS